MPNELDPQFEESLRAVLDNLPAPIKKFLGTPTVIQVVSSLAEKYALRIDQSGVLERELVLLLLGVKSPADFETTLEREAGVPRESVGRMVADINERIFLPLREEMSRETAPSPRLSIVPPPSYKPPPQGMTQPAPPRPAPTQIKPPVASVPTPPQPPMATRPPEPSLPPKQAVPPTNLPGVLSDHLLADHEEPPVRIPMDTPLPPRATPPPPPSPKPFIPPPTPRPLTPPPQKPIAKYTVDPYREPFSEN